MIKSVSVPNKHCKNCLNILPALLFFLPRPSVVIAVIYARILWIMQLIILKLKSIANSAAPYDNKLSAGCG